MFRDGFGGGLRVRLAGFGRIWLVSVVVVLVDGEG